MRCGLRRLLFAVILLCGGFLGGYLPWAATRASARPAAPPLAPIARAPQAPSPQAAVLAEPETHQLGALLQGAEASRVFRLQNRGARPVKILAVRSTCGCTVGTPSGDTIPPGQSMDLEATFKAGNLRGRFRKTLRVISDDPAGPILMHVAGVVEPLVSAEPEVIVFGQVRPGQRVTRKVLLTPTRPDLAWRPILPRGGVGAVRITAARPAEGGAWVVELTAAPLDPRDRMPASAMIPTGSAEVPGVPIRIAGEVVP